MVNARLHLICGNCGNNDADNFTAKIDLSGNDLTDEKPKFEPSVTIHCDNCCTNHNLEDNAEIVKVYDTQKIWVKRKHQGGNE